MNIFLSNSFPSRKDGIFEFRQRDRTLNRVDFCPGSRCGPQAAFGWVARDDRWAGVVDAGEGGELFTGVVDGSPGEAVAACAGEAPDCPFDPTWSPDAEWLAYSMGSVFDAGDLYAVSAEGGEAVRLTSGPRVDSQTDWAPEPQVSHLLPFERV